MGRSTNPIQSYPISIVAGAAVTAAPESSDFSASGGDKSMLVQDIMYLMHQIPHLFLKTLKLLLELELSVT